MKFRAGELEFNASVAESSSASSPRTGNALQTLTIQFRAQKAGVHEAAVAEALQRQSGGLYSLDEHDEPEIEWRVRESNWTYIGSEPWGVNHHAWRIEQVERLACAQLLIGAIRLEPYDYTEDATEAGVVRLAARALISDADLDALARLSGAVSVVRSGISDAPLQMRLAGYVWGERPEGLAVVLALESVHEPRVSLAGFDGDVREDLEDVAAALAPIDAEQLSRRRHARRRVANVDAWRL